VYGNCDPATDPRDFWQETEEELLDAINYLCLQVLKLREMRKKAVPKL
jgi:hypothetical protein